MPGQEAAGDLAAQRAFRIASSTKMVTTAVVLQLVEEGALSNTGYLLAGEAIEAATGQPLADVYRERILDPLDLGATWLACDEEPRPEAMLDTSHNPAYGLGVEIHGDHTYGHGGLAPGYGTQVLFDVAQDTVVVVLVDEAAEDLPGQVAERIMRALITARP